MKRQGRSKGTAAEEMQAVYAKESEVLTKNIGSELLWRNNVVLNHENLRMIAILHESMVCRRMMSVACVVGSSHCVLDNFV